jgi:hypothetical protein
MNKKLLLTTRNLFKISALRSVDIIKDTIINWGQYLRLGLKRTMLPKLFLFSLTLNMLLPGLSAEAKMFSPASRIDGPQPMLGNQAQPEYHAKSLFGTERINGHYYFTIPDSILGREMIVVTRLLKSPPNISVEQEQFGGEKLNTQVWRWVQHDNKIFIEVTDYSKRAANSTNMLDALNSSNLNTILYAFEIIKKDEANHTSKIDVTDFYNGDIGAIGISSALRKAYKITTLDASRSYIDTIKSFPKNIEVKTLKTYKSETSPTDNTNGAITFELNTSMLLLPEILMRPRIFDIRVRYLRDEYTDFGNGQDPAETMSIIDRWRLEPKDTAAYKRGELVEPKKQIVFYIDPATPKEWVPYFIKGVNAWQKAFEAAGFKNAIVGKPAPSPEEDPEFSTEDARYNVIRYFASTEGNAYGPSITDPRTGEIIESHLCWYHNQIKELHDWYFIQTSAANPRARKMSYSTAEMGDLICTTISHEIGHTLGLPHNWGASNAYSTDSLRSKSFTDHHGTAASIMDYARFNYVAQPGDGVTQFNPQVGEYDLWAIKWGYSWFPGNQSPEKEKQLLNKWVNERANNKLFFFGQEMTNYDPRSQNEDLGDNDMVSGRYGIANLKQILPHLKDWTYQPGKDESDLFDLYKQVIQQYFQYGRHAVPYIGGVYRNFKTYDEQIKAYTPVEKGLQKSAVAFLSEEVYKTPQWLLDKQELSEVDNALIVNKIQEIQYENLSSVLTVSRLARMLDNQVKQGNAAYTVQELLDDLYKGIFVSPSPDIFQRSLQREYIELLKKLITDHNQPIAYTPWIEDDVQGSPPINVSMTDITPLVTAQLKFIRANLPLGTNDLMKAHWSDLQSRIAAIIKQQSGK